MAERKDGKARSKPIRYTKELGRFICDKVADGLTVAEVCRKHKAKCPDSKTVYRWSHKHPEFSEQLNDAYQSWLMSKLDELEELSTAKLDLNDYDGDYKMAFEARRARMDALKFTLGKMAPILSTRFNTKQTVQHEGLENLGPQIVIQSYATPAVEKQINNIIEDQSDEEDNR